MTEVTILNRGTEPYAQTHRAMQAKIAQLKQGEHAEIWLVQHPPVFTQGQAGKAEHILNPGHIPVMQSDRGGQVTYHGPGQVILYTLIPLKHFAVNVRSLVTLLENLVIDRLHRDGVAACARADAPGVYVDHQKIASLGLRIRHGVSYHGLAVNVSMDLEPFLRINPCGYEGLQVTQLVDWVQEVSPAQVADELSRHLKDQLLDLARHRVASEAK